MGKRILQFGFERFGFREKFYHNLESLSIWDKIGEGILRSKNSRGC